MTDEERRNRNPKPEWVQTTRAAIEAMPEVRAGQLELHRVYVLIGRSNNVPTLNFGGVTIAFDPVTLLPSWGYVFDAPRLPSMKVILRAGPDGTLFDAEGNTITVRLYTGEDT
jgi:hypothetical protein